MAGEPGFRCARGDRCRTEYQARLSGPLLDRIDLRIDVPAVSAADLIRPGQAEPSSAVAARVARARQAQGERYERLGAGATATNAHCSTAILEKVSAPDAGGLSLLREAGEKLALSARAYHRVLRVARTLADLDGVETVGRIHLAEAISYRLPPERMAQAA
jgi:magnesium chelatase family protein